jgi:hypothetical protein
MLYTIYIYHMPNKYIAASKNLVPVQWTKTINKCGEKGPLLCFSDGSLSINGIQSQMMMVLGCAAGHVMMRLSTWVSSPQLPKIC